MLASSWDFNFSSVGQSSTARVVVCARSRAGPDDLGPDEFSEPMSMPSMPSRLPSLNGGGGMPAPRFDPGTNSAAGVPEAIVAASVYMY